MSFCRPFDEGRSAFNVLLMSSLMALAGETGDLLDGGGDSAGDEAGDFGGFLRFRRRRVGRLRFGALPGSRLRRTPALLSLGGFK